MSMKPGDHVGTISGHERIPAGTLGPGRAPARGTASVEVERVAERSAITSLFSTQPVRLLAPIPHGESAWVYVSSLGGGLVCGDQTSLDIRVGPGARCHVGTQSSTKVYRNPEGRPTGHRTRAAVAEDGLLVLAPDPLQAFAGSEYRQGQRFEVTRGADLVLVDWMTSGRPARGERWAFTRYESRNEIHYGGRPWLLDNLRLDGEAGPLAGVQRLGRFECLALVAIVGGRLRKEAHRWAQEIAGRPLERRASTLAAATPLADGSVLRFAAMDIQALTREIHAGLRFLADWLGGEPWDRRP